MTARESAGAPRRINPVVLLPLIGFLALAGLFLIRLFGGDASILPSTLIGKPAPDFAMPALPGLMRDGAQVPGLQAATYRSKGPTIVNVFQSSCVPCHAEHPLLMELAKKGVRILGINHKDAPENALKFLREKGNPYEAVGTDRNGRASLEWGVYGVPETFLLDAEGRIIYKHVGQLTEAAYTQKFAPLLARLAAK